MARKTKETKKTKLSEVIGLVGVFSREKADFPMGIVLIAISILMFISMISYLTTGQADQSILENLRPGEWMNTERAFANKCGSIGAIVAYWLITSNF